MKWKVPEFSETSTVSIINIGSASGELSKFWVFRWFLFCLLLLIKLTTLWASSLTLQFSTVIVLWTWPGQIIGIKLSTYKCTILNSMLLRAGLQYNWCVDDRPSNVRFCCKSQVFFVMDCNLTWNYDLYF